MKILYTADIHANRNHFRDLLFVSRKHAVGALLIGGDLAPHNTGRPGIPGRPDLPDLIEVQKSYFETELVPGLVRLKDEIPSIRVFMDLGNDDLACNRPVIERAGDFVSLIHMNKIRLDDEMDLIGYMCVPLTPFKLKDWEKPDTKMRPLPDTGAVLLGYKSLGHCMKQWYLDVSSDDTIEWDLSILSRKVDRPFIFISHSPPFGTGLDVLHDGRHVGSRAIRDFINEWAIKGQLIASFHGHIHESPMITGSIFQDVNGSICVNPGQNSHDNLRYVVFDTGDVKGTLRLYEGV